MKSRRAKTFLTALPGNMIHTIGLWMKYHRYLHGNKGICSYGFGFHISGNVIDSMQFTSDSETLVKVQLKGKRSMGCWNQMLILKSWEWKEEDTIALAKFISPDLKKVFQNLKNFFTLTKKIGTLKDAINSSEEIKIKCHDFVVSRLKEKNSL